MTVEREALARVTARTMSGVRVALAGVPDSAAVELGSDIDLAVNTVSDLRALLELPYALQIEIPYRWFDGASVVRVERGQTSENGPLK